MARIRSIKPEFFIHEELQDLEIEHPRQYCMLVFAGLWTQADAGGVFRWKPRRLKLSILPFIDFDMETTLDILCHAKFIQKFDVEGKLYGCVVNFKEHQRITGREAQEGFIYPHPSAGNIVETTGKQPGNNRETTGKQPVAQEREMEREREREISPGKGRGMGKGKPISASPERERAEEKKLKSADRMTKPPTLDEVQAYFAEKGYPPTEALLFFSHYESNGWVVGKVPMKNWHASAAGWMLRNQRPRPILLNQSAQIGAHQQEPCRPKALNELTEAEISNQLREWCEMFGDGGPPDDDWRERVRRYEMKLRELKEETR